LSVGVQGGLYHDKQNVCGLWQSSFFKFAGIADSALHQIISNQEKILQLRQEAARSYEFATIAVTTAEIVHQIVNTTRDISLPLKSIYDAYLMGKLNCVDERVKKLLADLPQSASHLLELTADFKKLSDPRENVKCNLRQVVELAERLYALQLKKRGIVLETSIPDSLTIGVPPHVAVLALATLVGNSKDAAPNGGHIRIRAWEEGDTVRCDVTDNGHGVPVEVQSRLFHERNVTTKSNGNGWGLYLVSRSLKDRHGSIELTGSRPGETIFTIRFPKYNGGVRG
jgi:signal transduction histidine kinase